MKTDNWKIYAFLARLLSQKVRDTSGKSINRYHYSHGGGSKTFKKNRRKGL